MRKGLASAIVFLLFVTAFSAFAYRATAEESDGGSKQPLESYIPETYASHRPEQIITGSATALLIQDFIPWDGDESKYWDANQEALKYCDYWAKHFGLEGITYDLVWSTNIPADLSIYKFIILASTQPTITYANIQANIARISTYVSNGGIYIAHACDAGWWDWPYGYGSEWTGYSILPNGVAHVGYYSQNIYINDPTSPIVYSTNNAYFCGWTYSTHGYFTNVPAGAAVIMVTDNSYPTYIIYQFGSGYVFTTTQTIEWGHGPFVAHWVGDWRPQFLLNELWYAYMAEPSTGFNGTLPTPPEYLDPPGGGGQPPEVGGVVVPVDKIGLLAPYIGLTSTILVATVAASICVKRVKHRKSKR